MGAWQVVSVASCSTPAQHRFCEAQGLPKHKDQLQVQLLTEEAGWSQTPCFGYLLFPAPHTLSPSWSLTFSSCKKRGLQIPEDILQCADLFCLCSPSLGLEINAGKQYSMKAAIGNIRHAHRQMPQTSKKWQAKHITLYTALFKYMYMHVK